MPPLKFRDLPLYGSGDSRKVGAIKCKVVPSLKLKTDKDVYRPGDSVSVTIEITNPCEVFANDTGNNMTGSLLLEGLAFEMKGIQKLDTQWFGTEQPLAGSKQRRGEHVFMDCSATSVVSNRIVSPRATNTYVIRTSLPSIIPPSYRGATIRYLYYVRSTLFGRWMTLGDDHPNKESANDLIEVEARIPLQIWITQKISSLQAEEGLSDGIVPTTAVHMDVYWKEMDGDSDWARANEIYDGPEEGYESSMDDISSVSSYNQMKDNIYKAFGSSLSLSSAARSISGNAANPECGRPGFSSYIPPSQLSVAEILYQSEGDTSPPQISSGVVSPSLQRKHYKSFSRDDDIASSAAGTLEPMTSEGFIRGRSYNIRLDDQVLLRFSPKNCDSTYYFSDTIGGTLTFFHEGARRCLEVSITLEISETIGRRFVHPSRRNSPTITKVQSDHYEVVADLVQTSFLFSIPADGPVAFSTPHVTVQWALHFEFFITPKNVDWTRYEHPLLIEGRDKTEWILPITVLAPPPGNLGANMRSGKSFSLEPLRIRT